MNRGQGQGPADLVAWRRLTPSNLPRVLRPAAEPDKILVDLRAAEFVVPAGVVAVGALVEKARWGGEEVEFRGPRSLPASRYLARIGLASFLEERDVAHDLVAVRRHDTADKLQELQLFHDEPGCDGLLDKIARNLPRSGQEISAVKALQELTSNVLEHSGSGGGLLCMQVYQGRPSFAVADAGIGVRASLSNRYGCMDDLAAVGLALRPGVSACGGTVRGRGLSDLVRVVGSAGQSLHVLSGEATVAATCDAVHLRGLAGPFPGVLVAATL